MSGSEQKKKAAGGKAKTGKKRSTTIRNLDVQHVAGGVKGGETRQDHKGEIEVLSRR